MSDNATATTSSNGGGLQSPLLGSILAIIPPDSEFVQVNIVNDNHWVALSTVGCPPSTVITFNILGGMLTERYTKLVADLMQSRNKAVTKEFINVQKQQGSSDCGLFTLAYITSI